MNGIWLCLNGLWCSRFIYRLVLCDSWYLIRSHVIVRRWFSIGCLYSIWFWIFVFSLCTRFLWFCSVRLQFRKEWITFHSINLITMMDKCVHTFDFGVLLEIIDGCCCSSGSIVNSTALLAINLFVQTCFISCNTCSSTPSSKKESRTPAITSSITAW